MFIKFEPVLISGGARPLSWAIRIRVAIDAARGLSFLHDSEQPVIYRDFKASNILLDSEFNARLSDFGLAKAGPLVIILMFLLKSWVLKDMLPLNILLQVTLFASRIKFLFIIVFNLIVRFRIVYKLIWFKCL